MTWTKPEYGKAKVDRAGHILIDDNSTEEEIEEARNVLNNWRSSHGYPMNTFQARLRQVSKKIDEYHKQVDSFVGEMARIVRKLE